MPVTANALREAPALVHRWARGECAPLEDGQLHIWSVDLDEPPTEPGMLATLLSVEERERAGRFRFARDRSRYEAGRATLREMLGAYLGLQPAKVKIGKDVHGKPFVAPEHGTHSSLRFNLAHADRLAVYAFTTGHDVGIDVERVEPLPDADAIAEGYFARGERGVLATLPADEKAEAFYRCWTRKEAYLKAIGLGLAAPLDRFEVTLTAEAPARLVRIDDAVGEAERWAMHSLDPAAGYRAAVAMRTHAVALRCARWAGSAPGAR